MSRAPYSNLQQRFVQGGVHVQASVHPRNESITDTVLLMQLLQLLQCYARYYKQAIPSQMPR